MCGHKFAEKLGNPLRIEKNRNGQKEKPKLDDTRKLRRIHFFGPDDRTFRNSQKNARRKLERLMAPAMPCKKMDNYHNCLSKVKAEPKNGKEKEFKNNVVLKKWNLLNPRDNAQNLHRPKIHQGHLAKELLRCLIPLWFTSLFQRHKQ